jgi:hypothetical protein
LLVLSERFYEGQTMSHLESQSERQNFGNQSDNGQSISLEGNAALRATSLQEFTTYRDAGKTIDPNVIPNLTIEGLNSTSAGAKSSTDSASTLPQTKLDADFDAGAGALTDTRKALRQADRAINRKPGGDADGPNGTNDQQPLGDEQGRVDLREAHQDLKLARKHFKELLRDAGHGEGAKEIKEGLRDLKKVDEQIIKAIRNDKGTDQPSALKHIKEALDLLDGEHSTHTDSKGRVRGNHAFFEIKEGYEKAK